MSEHRPRNEGGASRIMSEPLVGVIMGSDSDFGVMKAAGEALAEFDVPFEEKKI